MIKILYRPNSEHDRAVAGFVAKLEERHLEYELLDADTKEAVAQMQLYEIMEFPAVLAVMSDGSMVQQWVKELPLVGELEYYAKL